MNKQQKQVIRHMSALERDQISELRKAYTKALHDVKQRLKKLSEREQIQSVIYQQKYQEKLMKQINATIARLDADVTGGVGKYLKQVYEDGFYGTAYGLAGEGVPVSIGIDTNALQAAVDTPTASYRFSQRLYTDVEKLARAYKSEVTRGLASGADYATIAKRLSDRSGIALRRAERIARTEGGRVAETARMDAMVKARDDGADIVKQWDSTLDMKTRPEHQILDGQVREIDEPFEVGGMRGMCPHKFGIASMDINCRCVCIERARTAAEAEKAGGMAGTKYDRAEWNNTRTIGEYKTYSEWKSNYKH